MKRIGSELELFHPKAEVKRWKRTVLNDENQHSYIYTKKKPKKKKRIDGRSAGSLIVTAAAAAPISSAQYQSINHTHIWACLFEPVLHQSPHTFSSIPHSHHSPSFNKNQTDPDVTLSVCLFVCHLSNSNFHSRYPINDPLKKPEVDKFMSIFCFSDCFSDCFLGWG